MKEHNKQMALITLFATVLVVIGHSDITSDYQELWYTNGVIASTCLCFSLFQDSCFA